MDPPLAADGKSPQPPRRSLPGAAAAVPTLEIRLFYVRICPCAPDSVPPHLTLSHALKPPNPNSSSPSSLSLRRDRLDPAEVTYTTTDSLRLCSPSSFTVSDDRGRPVLLGSLDRAVDVSPSHHPSPSDVSVSSGWAMDCCTAGAVEDTAFVRGVSAPPSFEVYVAGCSEGRPLVLTQTVHLAPRRKAARTGGGDDGAEDDETVPARDQRGEEGSGRRRAPANSLIEGNDGNMDLVHIQRAGLSVIVACTTLMLELLRRKDIIWPTEPSMYRDIRRNANMQRMIGGGRDSCTDFIRMDKPAFNSLVDLMRQRSLLRDTIHVSIEEQLAMFLHTLGHSSSNRAVKAGFNRSGETISRYFNLVLGAMQSLREEFIQLPGLDTDPEIKSNKSYFPWFKDCIGLVGGAHIEATVPAEVIGHSRGRKDRPSQNVVAVVTPDKKFCHVLAGWEGSVNDYSDLKDALSASPSEGSSMIEGKYYLGDGGFTTMPGFIVPYQPEHYHLKEQPGSPPLSSKELFNLRHSSLCSKVKSAFGILKNRFKILCSHPSFPFPTLVDILLACCVLHNYILGVDPNDKFLSEEIDMIEDEDQDFQPHSDVKTQPGQMSETRQWVTLRDSIAEDMWLDYSRHNL